MNQSSLLQVIEMNLKVLLSGHLLCLYLSYCITQFKCQDCFPLKLTFNNSPFYTLTLAAANYMAVPFFAFKCMQVDIFNWYLHCPTLNMKGASLTEKRLHTLDVLAN